MVATVKSPGSSRYQAVTGLGYDGVVRITVDGYYGTGVLLSDGKSILTAAHLFTGVTNPAPLTQVWFETPTYDGIARKVNQVVVNPAYDTATNAADLAIVTLTAPAYTDAQRYVPYRDPYDAHQPFTFVGYGIPGIGNAGTSISSGTPTRRMADNTIDGDASLLTQYLGGLLDWAPPANTQFIADFDNGNYANDVSGKLLDRIHIGVGAQEGIITSGDSGGPAFIDKRIVGLASYGASLTRDGIHPDIDDEINSSYGEIAAWVNVAYYQAWIDQILRANYPTAPTNPADVLTTVAEGNSSTRYVYFLLEFTGERTSVEQVLSVDFRTRDGTATAYEDYLPQYDTLKLYPGETQAVIAVEILGDTRKEPDETFYLDVTNPIGGSFGDGMVMLTAVRTILNDDALIA